MMCLPSFTRRNREQIEITQPQTQTVLATSHIWRNVHEVEADPSAVFNLSVIAQSDGSSAGKLCGSVTSDITKVLGSRQCDIHRATRLSHNGLRLVPVRPHSAHR